MNRIGLIGSVCLDRLSASGQAIRTTILYKTLVSRYGDNRILLVNTHNKRNKLSLLFDSLRCILSCDDIIIMVSSNGRKLYYPLLYLSSKLLKRKIYNNVIGGNYVEYLQKNSNGMKYSKSFRVNWIQMQAQVNELKEIGLDNVELLQNTKEVKALDASEISPYTENVFRFCTFSRISIPKGIENAINTIIHINQEAGHVVATLDIYGLPDDDYKDRFNELIKSVPEYIKYRGYIDYEKSVDTLKSYYCLLFPTTFFGEGFPGTVWDALAAGVPTIATDWRYNTEVVLHGKTGYVYPADSPELLEDRILYAISHVEETNAMKLNCIHEAQKYSPEAVFPVVFKYFDK